MILLKDGQAIWLLCLILVTFWTLRSIVFIKRPLKKPSAEIFFLFAESLADSFKLKNNQPLTNVMSERYDVINDFKSTRLISAQI